jgi:hypothetical protein
VIDMTTVAQEMEEIGMLGWLRMLASFPEHRIAMAVAREISEASNWLRYAQVRAKVTGDANAVRLHYCEQWLASLLRLAKALP